MKYINYQTIKTPKAKSPHKNFHCVIFSNIKWSNRNILMKASTLFLHTRLHSHTINNMLRKTLNFSLCFIHFQTEIANCEILCTIKINPKFTQNILNIYLVNDNKLNSNILT